MNKIRALTLVVLSYLIYIQPIMAVQPNERLADPLLEERARILSQNIRCCLLYTSDAADE